MTFWAAGAIIGSAVIGGIASNKAAKTQANAAREASQTAQDTQLQMFNEQNRLQEPFRQAGMTGQNRLMELLGIGGDRGAQGYGMYSQAPTLSQLQMDPGYGFRFNEGLKALNAQAAARGGLISGGALKAAERYGQDMGSQEYQNAFNRYQLNKSSMLNPLQSLAGQGQTAANVMTNAAGQYGNNIAGIQQQGITDAAAARSSGYMGTANALSGGVGQYLNYQQGQNMLTNWNRNPMYGVPYSNIGPNATEWVSQG